MDLTFFFAGFFVSSSPSSPAAAVVDASLASPSSLSFFALPLPPFFDFAFALLFALLFAFDLALPCLTFGSCYFRGSKALRYEL
jgi:hypothetical protein